MVCGGLEKAWLFHEIGWCYMELSYHDEARDCGIRSLAAADEIAHEKWQMTANVLVAQSECNYSSFLIFTKEFTVTVRQFICLIVIFLNNLVLQCYYYCTDLTSDQSVPLYFISETWKL